MTTTNLPHQAGSRFQRKLAWIIALRNFDEGALSGMARGIRCPIALLHGFRVAQSTVNCTPEFGYVEFDLSVVNPRVHRPKRSSSIGVPQAGDCPGTTQ